MTKNEALDVAIAEVECIMKDCESSAADYNEGSASQKKYMARAEHCRLVVETLEGMKNKLNNPENPVTCSYCARYRICKIVEPIQSVNGKVFKSDAYMDIYRTLAGNCKYYEGYEEE